MINENINEIKSWTMWKILDINIKINKIGLNNLFI